MHGQSVKLAVLGGLLLLAAPATAAAPTIVAALAEPGSPVDAVGQAVLYFVGGRTLDEAGGPAFNPFAIDGESLLSSVGAFFLTTSYDGVAVHEGELSIFPQYAAPHGAFEPSAAFPPIIPFAFRQAGICHAGFVTGFPVPDSVHPVDLRGELCHAATVEERVHAAYLEAGAMQRVEPAIDAEPDPPPAGFDPALPSDGQLELAAWAAYGAAYERAVVAPDYRFVADDNFAALRDVIVEALAREGLGAITVAETPSVTPSQARACAPTGSTVLRLAVNSGDAGITIAVASSRRLAAYHYEPDVSNELQITHARDCATSGPGRAPPATSR